MISPIESPSALFEVVCSGRVSGDGFHFVQPGIPIRRKAAGRLVAVRNRRDNRRKCPWFSLAAGSVRQADVGRDAVEPGAERTAALKSAKMMPGAKQRFL